MYSQHICMYTRQLYHKPDQIHGINRHTHVMSYSTSITFTDVHYLCENVTCAPRSLLSFHQAMNLDMVKDLATKDDMIELPDLTEVNKLCSKDIQTRVWCKRLPQWYYT